ncbi:MAG TPA: enoyl-CoA hydratase-related protein [Oligoflexia bacterium]|nr:enoyl-CoA hydratase-related protein [Oligoflexia bacterium]HMP26663.1 enoyl-CoA hydratase-related protein [Oligoflexia bacterium]
MGDIHNIVVGAERKLASQEQVETPTTLRFSGWPKVFNGSVSLNFIDFRPPISRSGKQFAIAELKIGSPEKKVTTIDSDLLAGLEQAIVFLEKENINIDSLIIRGEKPEMFCLGADINQMEKISTKQEASEISKTGQQLLNRFAALNIFKIALIEGPALGGGFELALAADLRISIKDKPVKIGLPEVKLGIIPGWGGIGRLLKLVGISEAIKIASTGKILSAEEALKKGLIDYLMDEDRFKFELNQIIAQHTRKRPIKPLISDQQLSATKAGATAHHKTFTKKILNATIALVEYLLPHLPLLPSIYEKLALRQVHRQTNGKYPAAEEVVKVALTYISKGEKAGNVAENQAVADLLLGATSKNLRRLWMLSKKHPSQNKEFDPTTEQFLKTTVYQLGVLTSSLTNQGYPLSLIEKAAKNIGIDTPINSLVEQFRLESKIIPLYQSTTSSRKNISLRCQPIKIVERQITPSLLEGMFILELLKITGNISRLINNPSASYQSEQTEILDIATVASGIMAPWTGGLMTFATLIEAGTHNKLKRAIESVHPYENLR